jgi:hypothetical protein
MASPHVANDLLEANGGAISPAMFPQFDTPLLESYLTKQLDAGYARANVYTGTLDQAEIDAAAIAWAYYESFLNVWRRLSQTPAQAAVDGEASRNMLASQIQTFKALADEYRARYESVIPTAADESGGLQIITGVPTSYRY